MATTTSVASTSQGTLDVPSLVSQLMTLERRPIDKLNTQVASYQTKLSSFGTISGLVSGFQTSLQGLKSSFEGYSTTSSDSTVATASAASNAVAGTYSLTVTNLAQSQNLVTPGRVSSTAAISDGTATTVTFDFGTISGGSLAGGIYSGATFATNGSGTHSITVDGTNNTLQGISDAINAGNFGVAASIVNDGSGTPYRLALTSTNSGVSNSIKITASGGDGTINSLLGYDPGGVQNLNQTAAATNANFTVNGVAISKSSNSVTDAIQGVTLELNKSTASAVNLVVARDTNSITTSVTSFIDAYNALVSQLKSRSAYGTSTTAAGGLAGDGTVRLMLDQMRSILMTPASGGTLSSLIQVGISTQKDGSLKLDSSLFKSKLASNTADVTNLFTSSSGFSTRFDTWSTSVLGAGGAIENRTKSFDSTISRYNDQITQLEARMVGIERRYTTQYSNLNMLLSSMNNTSSYLTQQLAQSGA